MIYEDGDTKPIWRNLLEVYSTGVVFGLESDILRKMHRRIVKNFLDVSVLLELRTSSLSGYDVISLIHKRFNVLVSSGTVYSCLYHLEREGLIDGEWIQRKRVYTLTEKGKKTANALLHMKDKILGLILNLFITK